MDNTDEDNVIEFPQTPEPERLTFPLTRASERKLAQEAGEKITVHMNEAQRISNELCALLATDYEVALDFEKDAAWIEYDPATNGITLVVVKDVPRQD